MTSRRMLRPALVCLSALATASCGLVDSDPHRFNNMAQRVADIRLDGSADPTASNSTADVAPHGSAAEQGLRPALANSGDGHLKVEVMDPHELWDARDGGMRSAIQHAGSRVVEASAPVVADVVAQRVTNRIVESAPMRPAISPSLDPLPSEVRTTIQLGAFSTPEAARAAWVDVSNGAANVALKGLSPVFEAVEVNGRTFTRLKVAAPSGAAVAICRAAKVSDPWCARRT